MKRKETAKKAPNATAEKASEKKEGEVKKSKLVLWREEHPHGILKIVDMRAALK
jgi:hypothetical protein